MYKYNIWKTVVQIIDWSTHLFRGEAIPKYVHGRSRDEARQREGGDTQLSRVVFLSNPICPIFISMCMFGSYLCLHFLCSHTFSVLHNLWLVNFTRTSSKRPHLLYRILSNYGTCLKRLKCLIVNSI